VIGITVSSPERSYIEFTHMPSPIYQYSYVVNMVVSLPIERSPGVFTIVLVWQHQTHNN